MNCIHSDFSLSATEVCEVENDIKANFNLSITNYTQAIALQSNFTEAYNGRVNACLKKGKYALVIADYTQAIQLKPDCIEAYKGRGDAFLKQGNIDSAITEYTQAIQLKYDYVEAYKEPRDAFLSKGNIDSAITDYTQAISFPNISGTLKNRGDVHKTTSHYSRAIAYYRNPV